MNFIKLVSLIKYSILSYLEYIAGPGRVDIEWLACKNLQVSCKFLQVNDSTCKFLQVNHLLQKT